MDYRHRRAPYELGLSPFRTTIEVGTQVFDSLLDFLVRSYRASRDHRLDHTGPTCSVVALPCYDIERVASYAHTLRHILALAIR
jgi:hypothetical protein